MSIMAKPALKMRLLVRTEIGTDTWGKPVLDDDSVVVNGYFYQYGTMDPDASGTVTVETGKVILLPVNIKVQPHEWQAIEFDLLGKTQRWEIVGKPEPKFSLARRGKIHHWECLISRAAA
jgi:hypothetical protein